VIFKRWLLVDAHQRCPAVKIDWEDDLLKASSGESLGEQLIGPGAPLNGSVVTVIGSAFHLRSASNAARRAVCFASLAAPCLFAIHNQGTTCGQHGVGHLLCSIPTFFMEGGSELQLHH
jgi:hypothetical protein